MKTPNVLVTYPCQTFQRLIEGFFLYLLIITVFQRQTFHPMRNHSKKNANKILFDFSPSENPFNPFTCSRQGVAA